jgi:LAS superfamily LD-carboxypeptidase LdcB
MSNNAVSAVFEVFRRPDAHGHLARVKVCMPLTARRASPITASVGDIPLIHVLFDPLGSGLVGYLTRLPPVGAELRLSDGHVRLGTGIRFQPPSSSSSSLDETYALSACQMSSDETSVTCGNCTAHRGRVPWTTPNLVSVTGTYVAIGRSAQLDRAAFIDFSRLRDVAITEGAIPDAASPLLRVGSGYRSYSYDAGLWEGTLHQEMQALGASCAALWPQVLPVVRRTSTALANQQMPHPRDAWADRFVRELASAQVDLGACGGTTEQIARRIIASGRKWKAVPGTSAHTSGRAVDLSMGITNRRANAAAQRQLPLHQWLVCNAARFNFHPYPVEPWHWEHVPS